MQQPTDESVDQRKDVPGQYLDITLVAGQYKIYCPAMSFDPPTQSVTYVYICIYTVVRKFLTENISLLKKFEVKYFR